MDGHRRYADEPEPGWYTGQSQTPAPYDSGVYDRPSGAFRLPEQRPADGYGTSTTSTGSHALPPQDTGARIPIRGPEYPTIRPQGGPTSLADAPAPTSATSTYGGLTSTYGGPASPTSDVSPAGLVPNGAAPAAEPTAVVSTTGGFGRGPADSVYRARRPVSAVVTAVVTVLLMVPAILLLVQVTFVDDPGVRGIVPAVLLTLGLPLTGIGLVGLAAGSGPTGRDAWLRLPVAYLPVGLLLLLAAGLAVA